MAKKLMTLMRMRMNLMMIWIKTDRLALQDCLHTSCRTQQQICTCLKHNINASDTTAADLGEYAAAEISILRRS